MSVAYIGFKSRIERSRKTKIGTEVALVTRDSDTTFKVKRSPGRFTHRGVNASGSCSDERGNVLCAGTYCYVAVCRRGRRRAEAYCGVRPPTAACYLASSFPRRFRAANQAGYRYCLKGKGRGSPIVDMTYFSVAMIPVLAISQGIPSHKPGCMLSLYFRQTRAYPLNCKASPPLGRNQITLLNDTENDLPRVAARKRKGRKSNRQPAYR